MSRLNWNQRQSPTDMDDTAPTAVSYEFDYTHQGGSQPWPLKHCGIKFGPSLIRQSLAHGLLVFAEIDGFPHPIMVKEARWLGTTFQVGTLEKWANPRRVFTRTSAKGMTSSGLLIEEG